MNASSVCLAYLAFLSLLLYRFWRPRVNNPRDSIADLLDRKVDVVHNRCRLYAREQHRRHVYVLLVFDSRVDVESESVFPDQEAAIEAFITRSGLK